MSAIIPPDPKSKVRQLDKASEPDEQITPDYVNDDTRLSRLLMKMLRTLTTLDRRWWPQYLDFEDIVFDATGTKLFRFTHKLGGRVRWWVVDWQSTTSGAVLSKSPSGPTGSDDNTLVLISLVAGTGTIRVELAG